MKKSENFYRRDPGKALSGMVGLTLEERGVYNTVLDLLYSTWRPLNDDRAFLANWCGCAVQKLNPIVRSLIEKGRLVTFTEGGRAYLSDEAFEEERAKVKGPKPTRSGRADQPEVGEKSAGVEENPPCRNDEAQQNQSVTGLEKNREEKKEKPPTPLKGGQPDLLGGEPEEPKSRRKPKRPIPDDFPTADLIAEQQGAARSAGADVDMAYQAQRFRNWALGADHRYADWPKTWANWGLRTINDAPKRAAPAPSIASDLNDVWRRRVDRYRQPGGYWNTNDWGPEPGRPGCTVSPAVLAEFNLTAAEKAA